MKTQNDIIYDNSNVSEDNSEIKMQDVSQHQDKVQLKAKQMPIKIQYSQNGINFKNKYKNQIALNKDKPQIESNKAKNQMALNKEAKMQSGNSFRTNVNISSSLGNKKKNEINKLKPSDPTEHDLCQALLLLKKKLPNRSLQRTIMKLYQIVEQKIKNKQTLFGKSKTVQSTTNFTDFNSQHFNQYKPDRQQQKDKSFNRIIEKDLNHPRTQKLVIPGRKVSVYHSVPGEVAAISHQYFKKNSPGLEQIQQMQKNLNKMPIYTKPKHGTIATTLQNQQQQQQQNGNTVVRKNRIFYFKQSETYKSNFYNTVDQQKYKERRQLARLFIERGYGRTTAMDRSLPRINLERNNYKNLLLGVLTMAFRKLQSFIANQCQRTIKYFDQPQMKTAAYELLNCRMKLDPLACQSFFKILRISYGLGDVVISEVQTVQLYVAACKHIYGRSTTMQSLENMGRINNRRNMQNTLQVLKKKAQGDRFKNQNKSTNSLLSDNQLDYCFDQINEDEMRQLNDLQIWTPQIQFQFSNTYINTRDLTETWHQILSNHTQFQNLTIQKCQDKLKELIVLGLKKMKEDSITNCSIGSQFPCLDDRQTEDIILSKQADQIRALILSYYYSTEPILLQNYINQLNMFIQMNEGIRQNNEQSIIQQQMTNAKIQQE